MIEYKRELILEVMVNELMKPDTNKLRLNEDEEEDEYGAKKSKNAITIDSCF